MNETSNRFNTRSFVTLMIAFTGLGLPVTGIANHLYGFSPLTVARHAWMSAHNILSLLFVVFSIWHIVINRHALWRHIKGQLPRPFPLSREAALAAVIVLSSLVLFVGHAFHAGG